MSYKYGKTVFTIIHLVEIQKIMVSDDVKAVTRWPVLVTHAFDSGIQRPVLETYVMSPWQWHSGIIIMEMLGAALSTKGLSQLTKRWGSAFFRNRGGGFENLEKLNFKITIRYEIPTFSSVGPFFEEGGEGVQKISARSWNFRDFFNWGGPLQHQWDNPWTDLP